MPNLKNFNFYDTDAVKGLVLDVLVENHQLREALDRAEKGSTDWWERFKTERDRADAAEAKASAAKSVLEHFKDTRRIVPTDDDTTGRIVDDAIALLTGGEAK